MMDQLALFDAGPAPAAAAAALVPPVNTRWLSDDVEERREGVMRSADFWQRTHDASGLARSEEAIYAGNLRRVADDMQARPEYYAAKPMTVSDFRWWVMAEEAAH
jgi:hypothetical protein